MSWLSKNKFTLITTVGLTVIAFIAYKLLKKEGFVGGVKADDWIADKNYWMAEGYDLSAIGKKSGLNLSQNRGLGGTFSDSAYQNVKKKTSVYWAVFDIGKNKVVAQSENAETNVYAASVSKAVVVGAAVEKNNGKLPTADDVGKAIRLLVISDNNAWTPLQTIAGGADAVNNFSQKRGYKMQPARSGGNNINAVGMCRFWADVLRNNFKGAETVFKITSSCQTSNARSRKYIPKTSLMGSKTGTYLQYNHDSAWLQSGNNWYAITVLTDKNNGSEDVALCFGGLFNEFCR